MTETEKEPVAPAEQAEAERYRRLRPAFDRFENRHYIGLAASVALHLAVLMGLKWAIIPQPPRPLVVEVDLLSLEPIKASPQYRVAKAKPITGESRVRQKMKPASEPKPKPVDPDQEMTMEVVRAAPASQRKRVVKSPGSAPAVALPDTSSPLARTSQAIPGQSPAAASYQKAEQLVTVKPSMASAGQQASSRMQSRPEAGVEKEQGPVLIASNAPASQTLSPDHRHSSKRKKDYSSKGGSRQTAMGGGPRSETSQPYSLQSSGSGASTLAAGRAQDGARTSTPSATSAARSIGTAPNEIRATEGQAVATAGAAVAPEQARGAGAADRVALASSPASSASSSGSPTEIHSSGGQTAVASGGSVTPGQMAGAGSATGSAVASGSSGGMGKGMPGEEGGSAGLQGSGRVSGGSVSGGGKGAGDFSQPGSGSVRSIETASTGGGQLVASAGAARSIGPAVQSMSAVIVPDRGTAKVSRVVDDSSVSGMQRIEVQAIAHQIDNERYAAKSLKVNSPRTICDLPLMLAGFDRKPLPEGLASIMGSESAMVMEAPPELLPGNLQPTYPPAAMIGNLKGIVTIRAQVLKNGQVGEIFIRPPRAAAVLEQAAMDTVRRWRFKPARRNGEPVPAWVNIPIEYRNPT